MVGMPIFIDQGDALIKLKEKGIALGFDKDTATADEIYAALHEVLYNPKFKENIAKLSLLMKDVQEPPLNRVMNFMEYLIRHKGAEHLKLSSRHLSFIEYFCLDTIAFLTVIVLCFSYIQFLVVKYTFTKVRTSLIIIVNTLKSILLSLKKKSLEGGNSSLSKSSSPSLSRNSSFSFNNNSHALNNSSSFKPPKTISGSFVKEAVNRIQNGETNNNSFITSDYVTESSECKKRL